MERRFCIIVSEASWNKALCLNNTACAIMVSFIFPKFLIRPNCNSFTISCSMRSIVPRGKNLLTNVRVASRFPSSISHSSQLDLACHLSLLNQTICFFSFYFSISFIASFSLTSLSIYRIVSRCLSPCITTINWVNKLCILSNKHNVTLSKIQM